ncbi:hypothetical protein OWR28_02680 [Chryseobacterium sp. 1B4]
MKKTTIIIISLLLLLLGCKVKRVSKTAQSSVNETEYIKKEIKTQQDLLKSELSVVKIDSEKQKTKLENSNVEIRGKAMDKIPLTFFNVVNGDTINLLKVSGNADVFFSSNKSILDQNSSKINENNRNESKKAENKDEGFVSGLAKTAEKIQTKTVDVVKRDFQVGVYITGFLIAALVIIVTAIILYLKRK